MIPPKTRTPPTSNVSFDYVGGSIPCSPLSSPYEFTSRISSQSKATFICKENTTPCWSVQFLCSWHQRKWRLRWTSFNGIHRTGCRTNKTPLCNFLAPVKRDIEQSVVRCMCFEISSAICRSSLLACRWRYRSSAAVIAHLRPQLNPRTFQSFQTFSKFVTRCCEWSRTPRLH